MYYHLPEGLHGGKVKVKTSGHTSNHQSHHHKHDHHIVSENAPVDEIIRTLKVSDSEDVIIGETYNCIFTSVTYKSSHACIYN